MNHNVIAAVILALGLIVAGLLSGGRYELVHVRSNELARLDRLTGQMDMCIKGARSPCGFVSENKPR